VALKSKRRGRYVTDGLVVFNDQYSSRKWKSLGCVHTPKILRNLWRTCGGLHSVTTAT
jgi:hypothetical protein